MAYEPTALEKEDIRVIDSIRTNLLSSVDNSLRHLGNLMEALKLYRSTIVSSIDSSIEYADIISRYTEPGRNSTTYQLPGIMANTVASYDINTIKADNVRLEDCKIKKEKASNQRDSYFKSTVQNFSALRSDLNGVEIYNQELFAFLEMLDKKVK